MFLVYVLVSQKEKLQSLQNLRGVEIITVDDILQGSKNMLVWCVNISKQQTFFLTYAIFFNTPFICAI